MHDLLRMGRGALIVVVGCLTALAMYAAVAQAADQTPAPATQHIVILAGDMQWGPAPPGLPAGAQVAALDGDPAKAGVPFAIGVKVPDGYKVPPHWHPTDESLVVLSGTLMIGMGDQMDEAAMHALTPGSFGKMPQRTNHYVIAKGETVFHVYGLGPFEITYVNPADDPRMAATP
jgi:hypothetical protein